MNMLSWVMIRQSVRLCSQRGIAALLVAGTLSGLTPGQVGAQDVFVAIPPQGAPRYHIDFARNFFVTPEAEKADRANLYLTLKHLENLEGKVAGSADNLERALELNDALQVQFQRHYSYLYLRNAVKTSDEASLADGSALDAEISTRTAFLRQELMQIDDRRLAAFVELKPSLKTYLFAIEGIRRYRPYTLPLKEAKLLSSV